jgi:argininosuccinate lyase
VTDPGYSMKMRVPRLAMPDFYASMSEMNKASLVMLHEEGIISDELTARIGAAVRRLIARADEPDSSRSHDYLDFERDLIGLAGPESTWLHVGRSRQDMMSTGVSMWLRAAHLAFFEDLLPFRRALLGLASGHIDTVVPTYTHGVQAQPTSAAHYLLAFLDGLERVAQRTTESYDRCNRSPLGAGAGTTSAFALNRERLAALLGFDGIVDNAFDANLVAPIDTTLEFVAVLSTFAILVAQLTQDFHAQFYLAEPWLTIAPGSMLTGISSMMPQKRNPRVLELLREHASVIIGSAQSVMLLAHNISSGMTDVRESVTTVVPLGRVHELLFLCERTIDAVVIDPRRSLAEVNRDYSAMTNLAEHLVQVAGVPFREAHEFASQLTDFGRQHSLTPTQISYSDAARIYHEHAAMPLPLSEAEFARAIDPLDIIATRKGRGGPQRAEVERMLAASSEHLADDTRWLATRRQVAIDARAMLDSAFVKLLTTPAVVKT